MDLKLKIVLFLFNILVGFPVVWALVDLEWSRRALMLFACTTMWSIVTMAILLAVFGPKSDGDKNG